MFYIVVVTEWSTVFNIMLRDWCCSVSEVRVRILSREDKKCQPTNLILTLVGLSFRHYKIFSINPLFQVS
jgi:hypothetical protein